MRVRETVQLLTCETPEFYRSSSVASQQSWPEPVGRKRGEASQPDAWCWQVKSIEDRRVGTFPPGVNRWSEWRQRLRACFRAHGGHFEHRRFMFDICTWRTLYVCIRLPMDTIVLGWYLTKPAITIASVDGFYLKFGNLFAVSYIDKSDIVCRSYDNVYRGLLFFPEEVYG